MKEDKVIVRFPTWEVIAVVVGFFSTANEVPTIINKILYPDSNNISPRFIRWSIVMYGVMLFVLSANYFIKIILPRKQDKTEKSDLEKFYNQIQLASYLKTFGFEFVLNLIRDKAKITLFDEFRRPSSWDADKETFNRIYRLWTKKDEKHISIEITLMRDFSGYKVREAVDEIFGNYKVVTFFAIYNKYFAFVSARLIFFTTLHLGTMPFQLLIKNKKIANRLALLLYASILYLLIRFYLLE